MGMMNEKFTIQDMARITGLSRDTLRYYEKIGLIESVERAPNGHRRYTQQDVTWVKFLKRLRATGMSIQQMQHYTDLRRQGDSTLTERRLMLEARRHEVEAHVLEYQQLLEFIESKIEIYRQLEEERLAEREDTF